MAQAEADRQGHDGSWQLGEEHEEVGEKFALMANRQTETPNPVAETPNPVVDTENQLPTKFPDEVEWLT